MEVEQASSIADFPPNSTNIDDDVSNQQQHQQFIPPSQRADAPLAAIIPPELDDIDPK
jgi:hypothetical protein